MPFKKVDPKQSFPKMEEEILKFWEANKIFEKSVEKNPEDKPFIFYEGPPTANGMPGLHHVLARAFKDIIPRYKTMKGYRVERKAGWDTHGLPVEIQVEKALGLRSKQEIENIVPDNPRKSVIEFNKKCKESVWLYKDAWEKMTRRMAYWVDMKNPYITYENKYIESVWWVVAQIFKSKNKKGESLVYKGHKVVPYCYRCGTALSSHEVAQGYQKIKDNSVYVKFKAKLNPERGIDDNTYFLVWTTTPWTLPGNVALAVNKDIRYSKYKILKGEDKGVTFIIASGLANNVNVLPIVTEASIEGKDPEFSAHISDILGADLLGLEYDPLYETNETDKKAYRVISGDFVTTQDGTGIVHIAPAFGEDDAQVGKQHDLPTLLTVDQEGKINADVPGKGMLVKKKDSKGKYAVDELIIEDLKKRELFFKDELYEHDYPFCWRCDTPLIYYAKPSWFIRMSELAKDLVKNNENINWIPENIKEGRFGEWLRGVKDWAISRERYWGTPLPIWECECGEIKAIESIAELRALSENPITKIIFVRHGESEKNTNHVLSDSVDKWPLTKKGKSETESIREKIEDKVDVIITSPILRAKETAEILNQKFKAEIIESDLVKEISYGEWNEKTIKERQATTPEIYAEYQEIKKDPEKRFVYKLGRTGESRQEVFERTIKFLDDISKKYAGKTVLVVGHGITYATLTKHLEKLSANDYFGRNFEDPNHDLVSIFYIEKDAKPFDLHKPFIDDVKLKCDCGGEMKRVPEVLDVWFDSGSMPLAQFFYPNGATEGDKKKIESGKYFPADYISEAIDQTRGWFYTLHAIATLLHKYKKVPTGYAFKNVICLAHILDKDGKKMSKSRGNVVEPMEVMDKFGADMLRWMLFTINQPGIPKRFDIKGMQEIMNRVFRMLWNSYYFFVMYANIDKWEPKSTHSQGEYANTVSDNTLDRWILAELDCLIKTVDLGLSNHYDIYATAKSIEEFIDKLSNWYIRRSRKRFWKSESDTDKNNAYTTLHQVLVILAKLMAPFTPFISEEIYKNLTKKESVHLANYPDGSGSAVIIDNGEELRMLMNVVRIVVAVGLQQRAANKIKVRQPLNRAEIKAVEIERLKENQSKLHKELVDIIKEELNIKEVGYNPNIENEVVLDTNITEDLKFEGQAREIIRFIQEMRKEAGYDVDNRIKICYTAQSVVFQKFGDMIKKEVLADGLDEGKMEEFDLEKELKIDGEKNKVYVKRNDS